VHTQAAAESKYRQDLLEYENKMLDFQEELDTYNMRMRLWHLQQERYMKAHALDTPKQLLAAKIAAASAGLRGDVVQVKIIVGDEWEPWTPAPVAVTVTALPSPPPDRPTSRPVCPAFPERVMDLKHLAEEVAIRFWIEAHLSFGVYMSFSKLLSMCVRNGRRKVRIGHAHIFLSWQALQLAGGSREKTQESACTHRWTALRVDRPAHHSGQFNHQNSEIAVISQW
jgi:hypothetical protein